VPPVRDNRRQAGPDQNRHAKPVRKSFFLVELMIAAHGAGRQIGLGGRNVQALIALVTLPGMGLLQNQTVGMLATGTGKRDFHKSSFALSYLTQKEYPA